MNSNPNNPNGENDNSDTDEIIPPMMPLEQQQQQQHEQVAVETMRRRVDDSPVLEVTQEITSSGGESSTTTTTTSITHRLCHLLSLKPITKALKNPPADDASSSSTTGRYLTPFQLSYEAGGYLAHLHLNERNSSVVPNLRELMDQNCPDLQFSYEMLDTEWDRFVTLRHLVEAVGNRRGPTPSAPNNSMRRSTLTTFSFGTGGSNEAQQSSSILSAQEHQQQSSHQQYLHKHYPTAIIGPAASYNSLSSSALMAVYQIPQISGTSTATILDDKSKTPYFNRVAPTSSAIAEAIVTYLEHLGVQHFGCTYVRDTYGNSFGQAVVDAARQHNMTIYSIAHEVGQDDTLQSALEYLASTNVRYFLGIYHNQHWKKAFEMAYDLGIMGHSGYTWFMGDNSVELTTPEFTVNATTEVKVAKAMNGLGVIIGGFPQHPVLTQALTADFPNNRNGVWTNFVNNHESHIIEHFLGNYNFTETPLRPSHYVGLIYDAVMTAGIAACLQSNTNPYFTSSELLQTIRHNTSFDGASGYVTVNNITGTRDFVGLQYSVHNIVIANSSQQTLPGRIQFTSTKRLIIEFPNQILPALEGVGPFVYVDNTTTIPPALPPLKIDRNLIPTPVLIFGYCLMGIVMLIAMGCVIFAYRFRAYRAVKAGQPEFMVLIASGCVVMASAIIPMSFQEPNISQQRLNAACMSQFYVFSIGFVTCFSALYCKQHRVHKVLRAARSFRRIQVKVRHLVKPLVILLSLNLILLISWNIIDPLRWTRQQSNEYSVDIFRRPTSTYATCSSQDATTETIYWFLLFTVNSSALILANVESYRGRKLPKLFNETAGIGTSMFFLLESLLLGLPILVAVQGDPTAIFLIKSLMVFCCSIVPLGPIFHPFWELYQRGGTENIMMSGGLVTTTNHSAHTSNRRTVHSSRGAAATRGGGSNLDDSGASGPGSNGSIGSGMSLRSGNMSIVSSNSQVMLNHQYSNHQPVQWSKTTSNNKWNTSSKSSGYASSSISLNPPSSLAADGLLQGDSSHSNRLPFRTNSKMMKKNKNKSARSNLSASSIPSSTTRTPASAASNNINPRQQQQQQQQHQRSTISLPTIFSRNSSVTNSATTRTPG